MKSFPFPFDMENQLLLLQSLLSRREASKHHEVYLSQIELQVLLQLPTSCLEEALSVGNLSVAPDALQYRYSDVEDSVRRGLLTPLIINEKVVLERLQAYRQLLML